MLLLKTPIRTKSFTTATYGLWDKIAVDSIGPLPESPDNHKYILTVIDTFSRFIELIPIKDLTAEVTADAIIQIIGRYGKPCGIQSDNGTQFVNQIIDQLNKLLDIEHSKTHAYSHEENGIVERVNREVMRHLRDILFDIRIFENWFKYLPFVQRIKNSEIHSATGVAPASLVFGNNIDLNRGILTDYKKPTHNMSDYIANNLKYQSLAIKVAQDTQHETDMYHIQDSFTKKRKQSETEFKISSYVLVKYENRDGVKLHAPPSKLHPKLRGPFKVISKTERDQRGTIYAVKI